MNTVKKVSHCQTVSRTVRVFSEGLSKAITVLEVSLCLALAACSGEEKTVAPPQPQTPRIVVQPTVVVTGIGARITATINPSGIDTHCYFEYGLTSAYGRQLESKLIQGRLGDVVVSDTIPSLSLDSTYHIRLFANNSAGSTLSADRVFMVANTPPTIVSETVVSVIGGTAVFAATVNGNYRSTDCYFEYGVTTSFGNRTVSKPIGAGGVDIAVKDTIRGFAVDTTCHCRLVATNSAGTTTGSDRTFIIHSGLPVVAPEVTITPNGLGVVVTGTVNANGASTICFFEYGQTTAYGIQRPTKSIGSGRSDITISDTITVPAPGVTIHCRLVSVNSNGRSESADRAFTVNEFVYPLTVGTRWWYRYHDYQFIGFTSRSGNQIWEVIALPTPSSARIQVSRVDTVLQTVDHPDIQHSVTSFDVTWNEQSYVVPWNQLLVEPGVVIADYITVPRYVESGITTVVRGHGFNGSTACSCEYADGKGLVSYSWNHVPTQYAYEWLILDSLKVAP